MTSARNLRLFTLIRRDLQEYRNSLIVTPIAIAAVLTALMLVGVLMGGQIAAMGDGIFNVIISGETNVRPSIVVSIEDEQDAGQSSNQASPPTATQPLVETPAQALPEEEWNFSREWRFEPKQTDKQGYEPGTTRQGSLNPLLALPHALMLIALVTVTFNYLLGSLYHDRKDRSILFWKSMPVSDWEDVLVRFAVALVVAPAIFIGISLLLQLTLALLSMGMFARMGLASWDGIWSNIQWFELFAREIGGWVMTALWIAPCYGWLLLASSWARRSPAFAAVVPVVCLVLLESVVLGSSHIGNAIKAHLPGFVGGSSPEGWASLDILGLCLGLVFAVATLCGAVYLRRYRFEI